MIFCCRCGTLLIGNTSTNKSADVSPNDGHSNIHANSDTNINALIGFAISDVATSRIFEHHDWI